MQLDHPACRVGIFGSSGTGKTTFAERYLRGTPAGVRFIFDREGEWSKRLGVPQVGNVVRMPDALRTGWVLFDPDTMFEGRHEDSLEFFADWTLQVCKRIPGRKIFVVDELQLLITGHKIGRHTMTVIQTGRRYGLDFLLISQAPNLIHNSVRGQLTEVVLFRLTDELALEFPESVGISPDRVRALPDYHYISLNTKTGEQREGPSKKSEIRSSRRK